MVDISTLLMEFFHFHEPLGKSRSPEGKIGFIIEVDIRIELVVFLENKAKIFFYWENHISVNSKASEELNMAMEGILQRLYVEFDWT